MCDCDCELEKRVKWEQIKREHAHALAEKIRRLTVNEKRMHYVDNGTLRNTAADLIDPEVQR